MLKKLQQLRQREQGFTIIEVLIVLAIAALIMVIVLVAIPQLQRNQRNTARKAVASRIATEINNFAGNNNGTLPTATPALTNLSFGRAYGAGNVSFQNRYLGCGTVAPAVCTGNINDPSTGNPVGTSTSGQNDAGLTFADMSATPTANIGTASTALLRHPGDIAYIVGSICNGEGIQAGGNRNFALQMRLEGGATYCLDNR